MEIDAKIARAVESERRAKDKRDSASARLKTALDEKDGLSSRQERHDRLKTEMLEHFGVTALTDVGGKLAGLRVQRDLEAEIASAQDELLENLAVAAIGDAETMLDQLDRGALDIEIDESSKVLEDQDTHLQQLFSQHSKAAGAVDMVGGDETAAKLEEARRTTALEIEDGAARYLRLRLGILAAERALRIYRDQHRSSMMTRASSAFKTISRNAYKGLSTQPAKDGETLIAVCANNSSKIASDLSKGTRFQLYLALRVAGYQEFAAARASVPFIADDIMETFDDFRAEEAFRLFSEMAEMGQVIYLTHHRPLCEIAKRVCPGVAIHELS